MVVVTDLWAVGCIYAELLALRPIFKGEEAKMEAHHAKAGLQIGAGGILGVKGMPFQRDQMSKIVDVLGTPDGESRVQTHDLHGRLSTILLDGGRETLGGYSAHARVPRVC